VVGLRQLAGHLVENGFGNGLVEAMQRGAKLAGQDGLAVVAALRGVAVWRYIRAVQVVPAGVLEPGEGELFEVGFSHAAWHRNYATASVNAAQNIWKLRELLRAGSMRFPNALAASVFLKPFLK
jgi:hypothetical protein